MPAVCVFLYQRKIGMQAGYFVNNLHNDLIGPFFHFTQVGDDFSLIRDTVKNSKKPVGSQERGVNLGLPVIKSESAPFGGWFCF